MGVLLALYWSVPSVYTNSVAKAYLLPFRGLEGAGDGGRSCPSRSVLEKALPSDFLVCEGPSAESPPARAGVKSDMLMEV